MAGSVKSNLQLLSYKMDKISLDVTTTMGVLANIGPFNLEKSDFEIGLRNPFKFTENGKNLYVNGLNIKIKIKNNNIQLAKGDFIITGLFESNGFDNEQQEEQIIKVRTPAILFPYIRACITNVLSNAGFGAVVLPLINVNNLTSSVDIQIENRGELDIEAK